jgi:hypothetical protein
MPPKRAEEFSGAETAKRFLKLTGSLIFVVAIALAGLFVLFGGPRSLSLRRHFDRLVKTNDHQAVLKAAISLMGSTTNDTLVTGAHLTNLPPSIAVMNPQWVGISSDQVTIEFHGGFDHFGFRVRDEGDSWAMTWYTEQGHHVLRVASRNSPD